MIEPVTGLTAGPATEPATGRGPDRAGDRTAEPPDEQIVLPYPNGWFAVAFSSEVKPGRVVTRPIMGQDVVIFRTRTGRLRVVDPHCPHLGAHLGHGGRVSGEHLVCPFHAFAYDTQGACVRTGYDTEPPPGTRLRVWRAKEVNGFVFVWRHADGTPPTWEIPEVETAGAHQARRTFTVGCHPQLFVENAVDFGHSLYVHSCSDVQPQERTRFDEHSIQVRLDADRPWPLTGTTRIESHITVWGLGLTVSRLSIPRVGLRCTVLHAATSTAPGVTQVRTLVSCASGSPAPGRRPLLHRRVQRLLSELTTPLVLLEAKKDVAIMDHMIFRRRPKLAKGDGPIGTYRQWAARFYSDPVGQQPLPLDADGV